MHAQLHAQTLTRARTHTPAHTQMHTHTSHIRNHNTMKRMCYKIMQAKSCAQNELCLTLHSMSFDILLINRRELACRVPSVCVRE